MEQADKNSIGIIQYLHDVIGINAVMTRVFTRLAKVGVAGPNPVFRSK
jgi:hypothetical protein